MLYRIARWCKLHFRRNINKYTITEFKNSLSYETWDPVFEGDDGNTIFNPPQYRSIHSTSTPKPVPIQSHSRQVAVTSGVPRNFVWGGFNKFS